MGNRILWQLGICAGLFLAAQTFMPSPSSAQTTSGGGCSKEADGANCRKTCRSVHAPYPITYVFLLEGACGSTPHPLVLSQVFHYSKCDAATGVCAYTPEQCVEDIIDGNCTRTCLNPDTGEIKRQTVLPPEAGGCRPSYEISPVYVFTCPDQNSCTLGGGGSGPSNPAPDPDPSNPDPDPQNPGGGGGGGGSYNPGQYSGCCTTCQQQIPTHHPPIQLEITSQFEVLRRWIISTYFYENILPALMLMAEQLTVAGMHQVEIFGAMLDAKHQLETQRLFQQMTARAHKDYHPSESMCTFGSTARSLAHSDRKSNIAQIATATRMLHRQTLNGEAVSAQGPDTDMRSRLAVYLSTYCDKSDNQGELGTLCSNTGNASRRNIDVDFTRNVESRLTLDMEFANIVDNDDNETHYSETSTPDETDVFALAANLYSHNIAPAIESEKMGEGSTNRVRLAAAEKYLSLRSIYAKRSVAQNSFAALIALRTAGDPGSAPYVKAAIRELGITDTAEIEKLLGKNPSYFAQMEILTKKLYQNPIFYTELYDKPANIERKGAALQAIGLMQDRDLYNSLIRSEAVLAVLLETRLEREQQKMSGAQGRINPTGGAQ